MKNQDQNGLAWILGALAVVIAVGIYIWVTEPAEPILSETYTVM